MMIFLLGFATVLLAEGILGAGIKGFDPVRNTNDAIAFFLCPMAGICLGFIFLCLFGDGQLLGSEDPSTSVWDIR